MPRVKINGPKANVPFVHAYDAAAKNQIPVFSLDDDSIAAIGGSPGSGNGSGSGSGAGGVISGAVQVYTSDTTGAYLFDPNSMAHAYQYVTITVDNVPKKKVSQETIQGRVSDGSTKQFRKTYGYNSEADFISETGWILLS